MSYHFAGRLAAFGIIGMLAVGAHAQTDALNVTGGSISYIVNGQSAQYDSLFTLQQSLIINQIGFIDTTGRSLSNSIYQYQINSDGWQTVSSSALGIADSSGVRYYSLTNQNTYSAGTTVRIRASHTDPMGFVGPFGPEPRTVTLVKNVSSVNTAAGVVFNGNNVLGSRDVTFSSGNIKVSNPGSNVAPEPGTFALALTGGVALVGICIRRRRCAA